MVDGGGREKRAKGGRRRGQLYSARPTRGVPTGAEGFRGGEGWMARERRAIYRVVGGGGGWLRDWSKRLVAGADKKLHPKKVSPSPPASPSCPLAPHPHQPDSSLFSLAPMSLRSLSTSCRSLKPPSLPLRTVPRLDRPAKPRVYIIPAGQPLWTAEH